MLKLAIFNEYACISEMIQSSTAAYKYYTTIER